MCAKRSFGFGGNFTFPSVNSARQQMAAQRSPRTAPNFACNLHAITYQVRLARRERHRILGVAAGTLVVDPAGHLDQLGTGSGQVDQVQPESVRGEFHLGQKKRNVIES